MTSGLQMQRVSLGQSAAHENKEDMSNDDANEAKQTIQVTQVEMIRRANSEHDTKPPIRIMRKINVQQKDSLNAEYVRESVR